MVGLVISNVSVTKENVKWLVPQLDLMSIRPGLLQKT
jgi:hypothetical protein